MPGYNKPIAYGVTDYRLMASDGGVISYMIVPANCSNFSRVPNVFTNLAASNASLAREVGLVFYGGFATYHARRQTLH